MLAFNATDQSLSFGGRGFSMNFHNGYSISVQWGAMNYCENRTHIISMINKHTVPLNSQSAEVMIMWNGNSVSYRDLPQCLKQWSDFFDHFGISGWLSTDDVGKLIGDLQRASQSPIVRVKEEVE